MDSHRTADAGSRERVQIPNVSVLEEGSQWRAKSTRRPRSDLTLSTSTGRGGHKGDPLGVSVPSLAGEDTELA